MRRAALALAAAALAAAGCGGDGDDPGGGPGELAFFHTADANYELRVASGDGKGGQRIVAGGARKSSVVPHLFARPAWSPDGRRIAFAGVASGDPAGFNADIYVVDAGGGGPRRLTRTRDAFEPIWSPDGRTIVYGRLRLTDSGQTGALWAVGPDGSRPRQLTRPARGANDVAGSFAPDGGTIAFTRTVCTEGCAVAPSSVLTIRLDSSGQRTLVHDGRDPAISPDGERIAYVSTRDRNGILSYGDRENRATELYVAAADGSDPRRLTRTRDVDEERPAWSPGGARLAFQRGVVTGNAEATSIYAINPDGTCERPILADPKLAIWRASPAWRPGGRDGDGPGPLDC